MRAKLAFSSACRSVDGLLESRELRLRLGAPVGFLSLQLGQRLRRVRLGALKARSHGVRETRARLRVLMRLAGDGLCERIERLLRLATGHLLVGHLERLRVLLLRLRLELRPPALRLRRILAHSACESLERDAISLEGQSPIRVSAVRLERLLIRLSPPLEPVHTRLELLAIHAHRLHDLGERRRRGDKPDHLAADRLARGSLVLRLGLLPRKSLERPLPELRVELRVQIHLDLLGVRRQEIGVLGDLAQVFGDACHIRARNSVLHQIGQPIQLGKHFLDHFLQAADGGALRIQRGVHRAKGCPHARVDLMLLAKDFFLDLLLV